MGVRCTTMVVDKVGVVMILFTVKVSLPEGLRVILGMLARIRSTRALSSGTPDVQMDSTENLYTGWNVPRMPSSCPSRIVPKVGRTYLNLDAR